MFYVYLEVEGARALLGSAPDFLSAQFFAAKYAAVRAGRVAVYPAATGGPRQALAVFENGMRHDEAAPSTPPETPTPMAPLAAFPATDAGG